MDGDNIFGLMKVDTGAGHERMETADVERRGETRVAARRQGRDCGRVWRCRL
jgi:hypothetical protein